MLLPYDILALIAVKANSHELAYLIRSPYAAKRITWAANTCSKFTTCWLVSIPDALTFEQKEGILRSAGHVWCRSLRLRLLLHLRRDAFSSVFAWELAFRLRKNIMIPAKVVNDHLPTVSVWIKRFSSPMRIRYAEQCTGLSWCQHCENLLIDSLDHRKCNVTIALQDMVQYQRPLSQNVVVSSLVFTLGTLVRHHDNWPGTAAYLLAMGVPLLPALLGLTRRAMVFQDKAGCWALLSGAGKDNDLEDTLILQARLDAAVDMLAKAGIQSCYDIFIHKNQDLLSRSETRHDLNVFCPHCTGYWEARIHYAQPFVFRIMPIATYVIPQTLLEEPQQGGCFSQSLTTKGRRFLKVLVEDMLTTRRHKRQINSTIASGPNHYMETQKPVWADELLHAIGRWLGS